jgi:hypothetical protein
MKRREDEEHASNGRITEDQRGFQLVENLNLPVVYLPCPSS